MVLHLQRSDYSKTGFWGFFCVNIYILCFLFAVLIIFTLISEACLIPLFCFTITALIVTIVNVQFNKKISINVRVFPTFLSTDAMYIE